MFSIKPLVILALASLALADSPEFGAIVIRSGSQYQNVGVTITDGKFTVGGTDFLDATITDDGKLKLKDGSYAVVGKDSVTTGTAGSSPFAIKQGYLNYGDSSAWTIVDGTLIAGSGDGSDVTYALSARAPSGERAQDFIPSGSSDSSSNTTTSSSAAPEVITQTANGAQALGAAGVGAVLAAAGALLL